MSELNSAGQAWQMVTCSSCNAHYQCTPYSDYYNATTLEDGLCEPCLLRGVGLNPAKTVTVITHE